jgi:hypothetical protein
MTRTEPRARRRPRLSREIALVLAVKLLALVVIWSLWFAHPETPRLNAERVADTLYSPHSTAQERSAPHAQP